MYVPVVDQNQKPLMPTTPARARKWVKMGKATPFWKRGIFCVRLNVEPSDRETQPIAVGVDPGSKREGITAKSAAHTYLNIHAHAVDWVSKAVEVRRNMRRARRYRHTPYRANRLNRKRGGLPPSTKARWQWKLRLCHWLAKLYPIHTFVVEDIKAKAWGGKWGKRFSPLQQGKDWFYYQLSRIAPIELKQGHETKELRDSIGLKKTKQKLADKWEAHCVDSWVLANWQTGGHTQSDNKQLLMVVPLRFHRRRLHRLEHGPGHVRSPYGGTLSERFKRGLIVKHFKHGLTYVGGASKGRISLHSLETGKRLTQNAKPTDLKFLSYNTWRTALLPVSQDRGFRAVNFR